jgi:hypothetical protein
MIHSFLCSFVRPCSFFLCELAREESRGDRGRLIESSGVNQNDKNNINNTIQYNIKDNIQNPFISVLFCCNELYFFLPKSWTVSRAKSPRTAVVPEIPLIIGDCRPVIDGFKSISCL